MEKVAPNLRLLHVIEAVAKAGVPVTPTDVNTELGLPKATIHRLFSTLEEAGYLQKEIDGRYYSAGRRLRMMSTNILSSLRIRTARTAVLSSLAESIGETCNISIPDREEMVYLDRVETKWPLRIQLPIGTRVPFYCTASGKMYLSSLRLSHLKAYISSIKLEARAPGTITNPERLLEEILETRKRSFSQDNEEFMEGMIAIAVPIYDDQKRLVSTLSFHAPNQRLSLENAKTHVTKLQEASNQLTNLIQE